MLRRFEPGTGGDGDGFAAGRCDIGTQPGQQFSAIAARQVQIEQQQIEARVARGMQRIRAIGVVLHDAAERGQGIGEIQRRNRIVLRQQDLQVPR